MNKRDSRELGSAWRTFQRHAYRTPSPDLAPYVDHYWLASWNYAEPYEQKIVPYPHVHLTFRDGGGFVNGVASKHQIRVLAGESSVLGVRFRPGGFRPFLRRSVSTITDQVLAAAEVLGTPLPEPPTLENVEDYLRARQAAASGGCSGCSPSTSASGRSG